MDGIIVFHECLLEAIRPYPVQLAESFTDETVECVVRSLLRATFDNHIAKLYLSISKAILDERPYLFPLGNINLHELVHRFFEVELE